jgi:rhomboid family GlyGly-CTERM serine protease
LKAIPEICIPAGEISHGVATATASVGEFLWRLELAAWAGLILLLNLPLLTGGFAEAFSFRPSALGAGEWWRLFTHPFVHVSWYHLVLDAAAFLMAYAELRDRRRGERLGFVAAAGVGSLCAALWASPAIYTHGLCGLSGIAHGLTAVLGLELGVHNRDKLLRRVGLVTFLGVVVKSIFEAVTGQIAFASWHLGSLGTPIPVCHAGGVIGALLMWLVLRLAQRWYCRHFETAPSSTPDSFPTTEAIPLRGRFQRPRSIRRSIGACFPDRICKPARR